MSYLQNECEAEAIIAFHLKSSFCCPLSDLDMSGVLPRPSLPRGTERLLWVDGQALDVLGVAPAGAATRLYNVHGCCKGCNVLSLAPAGTGVGQYCTIEYTVHLKS